MLAFISEHSVTFILLGGLIAFFVIRDIIYAVASRRVRRMHKAQMAEHDRRLGEISAKLNESQDQFIRDMAQIDDRFNLIANAKAADKDESN